MTAPLIQPPTTTAYIGRFAPSPSGPLHFGSLVTALASYLEAKTHAGLWLVRMEDLDPPREQAGAAAAILRSLEAHGLHWDSSILYQSQRFAIYQQQLDVLIAADLAYPCSCSRQRLQSLNGIYDGHCRQHPPASTGPLAWRLKLNQLPMGFTLPQPLLFDDIFQGLQQPPQLDVGDPILKRRDGFYAYPLAVVVDDIAQGITHVVRGADLLEVTDRQIALFHLLGQKPPSFGHIPLALQENGQKLSKQNQAPALVDSLATQNLWQALAFLGQNPPTELYHSQVQHLLHWAQAHWQPALLRGLGKRWHGPNHLSSGDDRHE